MYLEYSAGKQTYSELEDKYRINRKTIRKYFDDLSLAELKNEFKDREKINLVFDACHFKREFCLFLFRSNKRNIHYDFKDSEKITYYEKALKEINQRYEFSSFTIDGRRGGYSTFRRLISVRSNPALPLSSGEKHSEIYYQKTKDRMWKGIKGSDYELKVFIKRGFHRKIQLIKRKAQRVFEREK